MRIRDGRHRWLSIRAKEARKKEARDAHGLPKLEGNVFLRRVPTVCIATPRALTNRSPVFTHICMLPRSRRRTWDRVYARSCLRRDTSTEKLLEGWNDGDRRNRDCNTNEAYTRLTFLSGTFSTLRSGRKVESRRGIR